MVPKKLDLSEEFHTERRKGSSNGRATCQSTLQDRLERVVMGRTTSSLGLLSYVSLAFYLNINLCPDPEDRLGERGLLGLFVSSLNMVT